jgi:hypothetical protein
MDLQAIVNAAPPKPPQPSQGSRSSLGETWVSCKNEIYKVYMAEKNTLPKTMELFEREYGLKAWWVHVHLLPEMERGVGVVTTL